jgi:chromosome partitioning protein
MEHQSRTIAQVKEYFKVQGLNPAPALHKTNRAQFSLEIDRQKYLVEINDWKTKLVNLSSIQSFYQFLLSREANPYAGGLYIAQKGFSETVKFFLNANTEKEIVLGLLNQFAPHIDWLYPIEPIIRQKKHSTKIGLFTCKGGVGKTTIAAHLANILSELGYTVALVDEDPEGHLRRILGHAWTNVPCYTAQELLGREYLLNTYDFVIHDYPPSLQGDTLYSIAEMDYCLVPVNLSPLSLGSQCEIVHKTFNYIQQLGSNTKLLALVNNEIESNHPVSLNLQRTFKQSLKDHKNASLVPISIRHSKHLYYWGKGNIFSGIGKQSTAYQDFIALADYLLTIIESPIKGSSQLICKELIAA